MFQDQVKESQRQMIEKENADVNFHEVILENKDNEENKISPPYYGRDEEWVREYIEQFGEEPSFF